MRQVYSVCILGFFPAGFSHSVTFETWTLVYLIRRGPGDFHPAQILYNILSDRGKLEFYS